MVKINSGGANWSTTSPGSPYEVPTEMIDNIFKRSSHITLSSDLKNGRKRVFPLSHAWLTGPVFYSATCRVEGSRLTTHYLRFQQYRQVVQTCSHIRMARTQRFLTNDEGTLVKRLSVVVLTLICEKKYDCENQISGGLIGQPRRLVPPTRCSPK